MSNAITITSARREGGAVIVTASDGREFKVTEKAGNLYSHVEVYYLPMGGFFGNTREVCILRKSTTKSARGTLGKRTHCKTATGLPVNTGLSPRNGSKHLRSVEIK